MPNPAASPPVEDDLMYSPPPPPHNLRWLLHCSLDLLVRLLVGVLICALGIGLIEALIFILHLLGFPLHIGFR
ncbi:MAG TPA: hypothetical protein VFU32_10260 [Ktedonobacterales bacterium]|nr:hypothetical protein [Ktedonobacterales bacterium]